jgi:hypothetical protein
MESLTLILRVEGKAAGCRRRRGLRPDAARSREPWSLTTGQYVYPLRGRACTPEPGTRVYEATGANVIDSSGAEL